MNVSKAFKHSKSPGNDALTAELYKAFWHVLGDLMVESLSNGPCNR